MIGTGKLNRTLAGIAGVLGGAAVLAIVVLLAYPRAVPENGLGDGWQCRSTAFSTSCTRVHDVHPAAPIVPADPRALAV
jgi:hypothetical protein